MPAIPHAEMTARSIGHAAPEKVHSKVVRLEQPERLVRTGVTVVIPALNEAETIGDVVYRVREFLGPDDEVIVVNDGSTDDTAEVAEAAGARVISRPYRFG